MLTPSLSDSARSIRTVLLIVCLLATSAVRADGPVDNRADKVRPIPPTGITLAEADRDELQRAADQLGREIDAIESVSNHRPNLLEQLPNVRIFHRAVSSALKYNEFFDAREIPWARDLLRQGNERVRELANGRSGWNSATGMVVRGYVSKIDGSVQPYGLVVPSSFTPGTAHRFRLDVWCHGRGETLSEVNFLHNFQLGNGEFTPRDTFVLHPYGRYCNANKFAGEVDLFEALEDVKRHYLIDDDRLVMRGFSMGGAACWQFAVHYPSMWAAAAPGAGFAETPEFLRVFQNEGVQPAWYERKLWRLYDCTDYAENLFNCPTIAYSGEKDRQKQAADVMAKALAAEGIDLAHIIGEGAGHNYTPKAKDEINRRIDGIAEIGRLRVPPRVRFTTWTLRYNRCAWVEIDGLKEHWERARVEAVLLGKHGNGPEIVTSNVSALTLDLPPGTCPLEYLSVGVDPLKVEIDDQSIAAPRPRSDRSWTVHLRQIEGKWQLATSVEDGALRKRHGLQGPIDDAFMNSFLIVRPTGKASNDRVGRWTAAEMDRANDHWRRQFRGEPRVKDDRDVSEPDIAHHNLILWGDPASNSVLARVAGRLPLKWEDNRIGLGDQEFDATHHVPILIYPNPLNPNRYVVLNSGFTFREYDYLNNARQVPKLPDFAVVDIDTPVSPRAPGRVSTAGFFNEHWELPPATSGKPR